jgi:hypothetical protein
MDIIPMKKKLKKELLWAIKLLTPIKKIFKSKLLSKKAKLKLFWTIIRPVITCARETRMLK